MSKLQREDRLKAAFSHFDIDSNGVITREELLKSLQSLGVNEQGVDDIIADVDKGVKQAGPCGGKNAHTCLDV